MVLFIIVNNDLFTQDEWLLKDRIKKKYNVPIDAIYMWYNNYILVL